MENKITNFHREKLKQIESLFETPKTLYEAASQGDYSLIVIRRAVHELVESKRLRVLPYRKGKQLLYAKQYVDGVRFCIPVYYGDTKAAVTDILSGLMDASASLNRVIPMVVSSVGKQFVRSYLAERGYTNRRPKDTSEINYINLQQAKLWLTNAIKFIEQLMCIEEFWGDDTTTWKYFIEEENSPEEFYTEWLAFMHNTGMLNEHQ